MGDESIVHFDELDGEKTGGADPKFSNRLADALKVLKEKLKPEDYASIASLLGVKTDLTNAELLAEIKKLAKGEYPPPSEDEKKKKDEEQLADYKGFMKTCMKDGKNLADCATEWKKKYPEPAKAMEANFAKLDAEIQAAFDKEKADLAAASAKDKEVRALSETIGKLTAKVEQLEGLNKNSAVKAEVDKLVANKNISPGQAADVLKLAADMTTETREAFLGVYRKQKLTVTEDVGEMPGANKVPAQEKAKILKSSGLSDLLREKGSAAAVKQLQELN